jgi:tetratricopeptide (TPR) repeat protein
MTYWVSLLRGALALLTALVLGGCLPAAHSRLDEEREPHFLTGKDRVSTLDYKGGIESFEKALEVNPQSASAHFELACLFEKREPDPAAAIYHYERYLQLRPGAENAEIVKQHIMACKQELARTVSLGPVNEKMQREFEQLVEENKRLNEENKRLHDDLEKWRAYATRSPVTNQAGSRPLIGAAASQSKPGKVGAASETTGTGLLVTAAGTRAHTVSAGETPTSIARKYGIRLDSLMAANPHLDARRLRVGQTLSIPSVQVQ